LDLNVLGLPKDLSCGRTLPHDAPLNEENQLMAFLFDPLSLELDISFSSAPLATMLRSHVGCVNPLQLRRDGCE
ncbi:MAG TPA: hypothetical protein DCM40_27620, partial [Maribacter sp.]|nr:hypothetical protein [Maribacter sp.]